MDLKALMSKQYSFDADHNWILKSDDPSELVDWLHRDLVGLLGELGEFANTVKKMALMEQAKNMDRKVSLVNALKKDLSEEFVDSFIYLMRIATHLKIDVEKAYVKKLKLNKKRYVKYKA